MKASVTSLHVNPHLMDEFIRLYEELAPGIFQDMGELKKVHLLTDRESGKVLIIGDWETEAAARAWETDPRAEAAVARLQPLMASPPQLAREYYDISFEQKR